VHNVKIAILENSHSSASGCAHHRA